MTTVSEIFETMAYGPAPESDKHALEWVAQHGGYFGLFIGGGWTNGKGGETFDVVNPATTVKLARVTQAGPADVDAAVAAARQAFPSWSALSGHARARHLYALARAVQKQARLLAVLESLDNGKSIRETRDLDIPLVARHFYHHAGWAQLLESEFPGYGPVGVVGQIIPWNFPLLMVAWKVAPALAAGNTVVLKPAEFTPLTALCLAEMAHAAGLPLGVLNVLTGDGKTGELMVKHPDIDKIAFTGSTEVGRVIRKATAGSGKRLSLELGGKSPFIVFDDADLDSVVEGVVDAIWFNQGQVCCAGSRLLVHEGIAERLVTKLRARMEKLRVGPPLDKAIDMGAIVAPVQLERIRSLVNTGVEWVNCTNLFDAASGFGGYRESGFGREGGKEGMWEYLKRERDAGSEMRDAKKKPTKPARAARISHPASPIPPIDRTYKLFIGGAQVRPDQGYSRKILAPSGALLAEVAEGNRKDIRNAVEAAHAADGWAKTSGHNRGQVLYYLAENLAQRADEFAERISGMTGRDLGDARREVDASISRLFSYAAWADKRRGARCSRPLRGVRRPDRDPSSPRSAPRIRRHAAPGSRRDSTGPGRDCGRSSLPNRPRRAPPRPHCGCPCGSPPRPRRAAPLTAPGSSGCSPDRGGPGRRR